MQGPSFASSTFPYRLRNSDLKTTYATHRLAPVHTVPVCPCIRDRVRSAHHATPCQLISSVISHCLSRGQTPVGCQPPFGWGIGPLSIPLQNGLRFFRHPNPAYPTDSLTGLLPCGQIYGVPKFRFSSHVGLGACYRPGGCSKPPVRDGTCSIATSHLQCPFGSSLSTSWACSQ